MAAKKKVSVEAARKLVADADAKEQKTTDTVTEYCSCNALNIPHKHLDRGIISQQELEPAPPPPPTEY